jgi:multidrug efflux pump subunit AcrA (membrane-fusion protein)
MYYTEITSTELPLQVKPGMSVEVDILTDKRQALVVPYYILRNVDGENAEVLVQTEGTEDHEVRSVTIGTVGDDAMAEIRDGLREGEVLVWEVE